MDATFFSSPLESIPNLPPLEVINFGRMYEHVFKFESYVTLSRQDFSLQCDE